MAHDITSTDGLVLTGKRAWHGLGVVVDQAPHAMGALGIAGLDWLVGQWPLSAKLNEKEQPVSTHVLNVRTDTSAALGVVGVGYQPVHNQELAAFCDALGADGRVKIESAGSIRGGRRVWFLLQGESVWVNPADEVKPYLLVVNAHDGSLAVTCQPTTIRVVCKNTLHASLAQGQNAATTVRFRHEGVIADKLEDARRALGIFTAAREEFGKQSQTLQAKEMAREDLQRFWMEVYAATIDEIPAHPTTTAEHRRGENARTTLSRWAGNFDADRARTHGGANAWTALNAVTEWFDHQRPVRAASDSARQDNRVHSRLWGTAAVAKAKAMELALSR
jgi:phage/plasmid-like protein (TIGR03299 family)